MENNDFLTLNKENNDMDIKQNNMIDEKNLYTKKDNSFFDFIIQIVMTVFIVVIGLVIYNTFFVKSIDNIYYVINGEGLLQAKIVYESEKGNKNYITNQAEQEKFLDSILEIIRKDYANNLVFNRKALPNGGIDITENIAKQIGVDTEKSTKFNAIVEEYAKEFEFARMKNLQKLLTPNESTPKVNVKPLVQ